MFTAFQLDRENQAQLYFFNLDLSQMYSKQSLVQEVLIAGCEKQQKLFSFYINVIDTLKAQNAQEKCGTIASPGNKQICFRKGITYSSTRETVCGTN